MCIGLFVSFLVGVTELLTRATQGRKALVLAHSWKRHSIMAARAEAVGNAACVNSTTSTLRKQEGPNAGTHFLIFINGPQHHVTVLPVSRVSLPALSWSRPSFTDTHRDLSPR